MEEILASISRIVTEDTSQRPAPTKNNEVLELTETVDENGRVRRLPPRQPAEEPPPVESARPEPEPAHDDEPRLERGDERLVSTATAGAAAAALSRLATMPRAPAEDAAAGARTLEQIVGEALRPLLQAWLDEHLPGLVEKLVREEVARIVKDAGYG